MLKTMLIVGAALLAVIILVPVVVLLGSDMRDRKFVPNFPNAQTPATANVPLSVAQVRARLEQKISAGGADFHGWEDITHPAYGPQFATFSILTNENGNIDSQFRFTDTGLSSDAPISTKALDLETEDPGLPAYLHLPIPERQHDLQIQARSVWTATDLQKNGQPLPYNSSYFLHFKALSPDETQITVLGQTATVVDGKRWSVVGDVFFTAPRRVDNVLNVPPSPADKRAMLENVLQLLK